MFVSSQCCQHLLAKIWYGEILKDTPRFNLFCSTLIPFLAPKLISWESNKNDQFISEKRLFQKTTLYSEKIVDFFRAPFIKFLYDQVNEYNHA